MADSTRKDQRFNIDSFRANLHKEGYHNQSHFTMKINNIPNGMRNSSQVNILNRTLQNTIFRIDSVNIPGVSLATDEIVRYGFGPNEMKPYAPVFDKINMTVIDDSKGNVYDFFQSWMKLIINYDIRKSINEVRSFIPNQSGYEIAYKEDYAVDIEIITYDPQGNENIKITLRESYPIFLSSLNMNWASQNSIVRIPMTFTFLDWYQSREFGASVDKINDPDLPDATRPDEIPSRFNRGITNISDLLNQVYPTNGVK